MGSQIKPNQHSSEGKKVQIANMFNNIAFKYDFLNHFLSLNIDKLWRKKVVKLLIKKKPKRVLDVATGTADLAIASLKANPERIDGVDISVGMLEVGKNKLIQKKLQDQIFLQVGDAEQIPFETNTFDAVTVAFGVRNYEHLQNGLNEMFRVLNDGGITLILEFTMPTAFPIKQLYTFYFKFILPFIGKVLSSNKQAYSYLHNSVQAFPQNNEFVKCMEKAGFESCSIKKLSFGIAAIYYGKKLAK